jgi:peptidoglycan/LPS O-acetylase OafA/YrhL
MELTQPPTGSATNAASTNAMSTHPAPAKAHLDYLDTLRGLAAMAVVILHAYQAFGLGAETWGVQSTALLSGASVDKMITFVYGHVISRFAYAVQFFIVLSGYSLMLSVARSADGYVKGGLGSYIKRRIRRIWPPYYAALALSLVVIATVPGMNTKANVWWDLALPAFTFDSITSHLLFIQHARSDWFLKINPAMWTVAVEEYIYVLFPLLLLPLWRRFGGFAMATITIAIGISLRFTFRPYLDGPHIWFIGLFALGAFGASIGFSRRTSDRGWLGRVPWLRLGLALLVTFLLSSELTSRLNTNFDDIAAFMDTLLGLAVICLLVHLTEVWKKVATTPLSPPMRLLQSKPLISLGKMSYSLYLIHCPVVGVTALLCRHLGLSSAPAYIFMLTIGVSASVIVAYSFYHIFEQPFMPPAVRAT